MLGMEGSSYTHDQSLQKEENLWSSGAISSDTATAQSNSPSTMETITSSIEKRTFSQVHTSHMIKQ